MQRKLVFLGIGGLVIIGVILSFALNGKQPNINLVISPTVASVKIDGKQTVQPGKLYVTPGSHSITASFAGFASKTVSFTAKKGPIQTITVLLPSNSAEGDAWLQNHPKEANIRQTIGGNNFSSEVDQRASKYPIIKVLPFIGPANEYRIDYGVDPNSSDPTSVGIYITYYVAQGKQDALTWIQQQGFTPSSLNITYVNKTTEQQPVNNPYTN
jgi:hypothetical protein